MNQKFLPGVAATLIFSFLLVSNIDAQTRSVTAQEYIQSTSPLANGGSVVSRSAPGERIQTITTIAQLPSIAGLQPVTAGYVPKNLNGTPAAMTGAPNYNSNSAGAVNTNGSYQPYAYPTTASAAPSGSANFGSYQPSVTTYRQSPTLGMSATANAPPRLAQNCPTCTSNTGAAYQPPSLNYEVPNLNVQVPGQTTQPGFQTPYQQQPNYQFQPNIGTPQYGAQGASWYTPFVTGSGVYSPLIKLRNLPPGTYLGQGVIGQPTAYVDGQPVRNLLRYISP